MTDAKGIPGFEERFAEAKGCRMRYLVGGAEGAEALVLVHGLGGAASNFLELAPLLAESRRVLVPDLPGHGGSTPLPAVPNLSVYADRVALVAEREALLPTAVLGHSLGGIVALRLASLRPDDVTALVLAGSAGIFSTTRRARFSLRLLAIVKPRRLVAPWTDSIAASPALRTLAFGRWGASDPVMLSAAAAAGLLEGARRVTDSESAARALVLEDVRRELGSIRCPCLVLWGARDNQVPVADAFEFARRLAAPLRVIADCGHLLVAERPETCAEAITDFLGSGIRAHGGNIVSPVSHRGAQI